MTFSVRLASVEEKETIRSLLQPYLDELSRFPDEEADYRDGAGLYHYRYLDAYWTDAERFTYLLRVGGEIAGLALVRKAVEAGGHWEMAEYYVKPEFRRRGLGESAGTEILRTYSGPWLISFNKANGPSRRLWGRLAAKSAKGGVEQAKLDRSHDCVRFRV